VEAAVAEARRRGIPQILVVTSNVEFFSRLNFQTCLNEKFALFYEEPGGERPGSR
jgi:N-acetylglutamate synthase-like GNAT family acetyltransferase